MVENYYVFTYSKLPNITMEYINNQNPEIAWDNVLVARPRQSFLNITP